MKPILDVENEYLLKNRGAVSLNCQALLENYSRIKYNIEKQVHNIPKLSIWRNYGNKQRHIPTEINKPYA